MSSAAPSAAMQFGAPQRSFWPSAGPRTLMMLTAAVAGVLLAVSGLSPSPARAPNDPMFSAPRAADRAKAWLGLRPRPSGSVDNAIAVERMKQWLGGRDLLVEVQEATVPIDGRQVTIRNVLARKSGPRPGPPVMLMAHHDTVPGSPGTGDDAMGVAVLLEAAAALTNWEGGWQGRDVILLLTDAEESGLKGARHFANNHRWMSEVGAVINVDNRGNAGPVLLHEVGADSANLFRAITPNMGPVVANSLFAEVARHVPNATDFRVLKEAGKTGLNFALIEGHEHYHAASDTWSTADMDSLQHLGDAVMRSMYALAMDPADRVPSTGEAVFLDLGGSVLAWWPRRSGIVVASGCVMLLAGLGWLGAKRRGQNPGQVLQGAALASVCTVLAGGLAWLALGAAEWLGMFGTATVPDGLSGVEAMRHAYWPASGRAWLWAGMTTGLVGALLLSRRLLRSLGSWPATLGAWLAPAAIVTALAVLLPGVTAPLLPVVLVATLTLAALLFLVDPSSRLGGLVSVAVPAFMAGLLLTPIEVLSWPGVGLSMPMFAAARVAMMAAFVMPMACPRGEG